MAGVGGPRSSVTEKEVGKNCMKSLMGYGREVGLSFVGI